jgi:predicted Zn-dependent protease
VSDAGLDGLLFDGRTAAAAPVRVLVVGGSVQVTTPAGELLLEARLEQVRLTDAFASAPRQLTFEGGGVVEVADGPALTARLAAVGRRPGLVDRLQQRWPAALVALVVSAALLSLGYFHGLPALARAGAALLPARLQRQLGDGVLELLDGHFLEASALTEAERAAVTARVAEVALRSAPELEFHLLFRGARQPPGVNAFALPGGTVVVLDELVRRTSGDDRLLAVIGHELGHVARRHPAQRLIQAGGIGAVTGLLWGDISATAANLPALLALLDYSRDAEREADDDALRFLRDAGLTARPAFDAFCLLQEVEQETSQVGFPRLLSTHPDLKDRLDQVREVAGASWTCPPRGERKEGARK